MTQWTIAYQDAPEMDKIRGDRRRRDPHIAYLRAHPEINVGGPLALDPMQDFPGAIWTIEAATRDEAERLILQDPYYVPSLRRYSVHDFSKQPVAQQQLS
jgi:uncharacterized protein YciI